MQTIIGGRPGTEGGPSSALPLIGEVIKRAMKATHIGRLPIGQMLVFIVVAVMVTGLFLQSREISRLRDYYEAQADVLYRQQQWATKAISHLELIRKYEVPYRYLEILSEVSGELGLNLEFMVGLMQVESSFNPNAVSNKNAYGLMQVRLMTARELDPTIESFWQLYDPERNIRLGAVYFSKLLDRYDGDYRMAALAYNMGPTRLDGELSDNTDIADDYYRRILTAGIVD